MYHNPPLFGMDWNSPEVLQAEIAAANGVATARSVARLYGCLACGGSVDGVRVLRPETIAAGRRERSAGDDPLSGRPLRFGAGYELWARRRSSARPRTPSATPARAAPRTGRGPACARASRS